MKNMLNKRSSNKTAQSQGFGLTETLVALSAGTLVIMGGATALRQTGSLINQASQKTVLRQNKSNGMRLLRSEVERGLHIIINAQNDDNLEDRFKLGSKAYIDTVNTCTDLANSQQSIFKPIFGVKMAKLNAPILYGYGVSPTSRGYDLVRCGAPLNTDGEYIENETNQEFLSVVINHLGVMGCSKDADNNFIDETCNKDHEDNMDTKSLSEVLNLMPTVEFAKSESSPWQTPIPTQKQPALRIETDSSMKLIKFVDPNPSDPNTNASYLQISRNGRSLTTEPLHLAAFARADKRRDGYGNDNGLNNISIFKDITSKHVRFILDGSGSMSACILWGDTRTGHYRKYYDPNGGGYFTTDWHCHVTRMETLQQELRTMIADLDGDTHISLEMFSAPGGKNHEQLWELSKNGLIRIDEFGVRESALEWVNTLDDINDVGRWGGTIPWPGLNRAFNDNQADTVYFLSDGKPNSFRDGSFKSNVNTGSEVVDHYITENAARISKNLPSLKIHTIALGIKSDWMNDIATQTNGNYMQYDREALSETSDNN